MTAAEYASKRRKLQALAERGATEGEKQAAREAIKRMDASNPQFKNTGQRSEPFTFRYPDEEWSAEPPPENFHLGAAAAAAWAEWAKQNKQTEQKIWETAEAEAESRQREREQAFKYSRVDDILDNISSMRMRIGGRTFSRDVADLVLSNLEELKREVEACIYRRKDQRRANQRG